jgi:hypothetical protein
MSNADAAALLANAAEGGSRRSLPNQIDAGPLRDVPTA